jgi:hypothetical protein
MSSIRVYFGGRGFKTFLVLVLAAIALTQAGCATRADVVEVVTTTNLAMITPELGQPGKTGGDAWKEPVEKIDKLISEHADQKKLVAALRLRQAMVLTVYGQNNLANAAFDLIEAANLHSERDKALYGLREEMTWWYRRATHKMPLTKNERGKATTYLENIKVTCDTLTRGSDIRHYLETMRGFMAARIANDSPIQQAASKAAVEQLMAEALKRYVGTFDAPDIEWLKIQCASTDLAGDEPLAKLRMRFELRTIVKKYFSLARESSLSPTWEPAWLKDLYAGNCKEDS